MRRYIILSLLLLSLLIIVIPLIVIEFFDIFSSPQVEVDDEEQNITVMFHKTGEIKLVPLEQYLVGVVAAEMPAEFELEALKAQAVAARTYALKKFNLKTREEEHPEAVVCTDPMHCQAWISSDEQKKLWGVIDYIKYRRKIERAVKETKGIVITYKGRLIDPVYHSTCGGRTENSEDVWQFEIPYLRSVQCPYDKESPRYQETRTFTMHQLDETLGTDLASLPVSTIYDRAHSLFRILEKTSTGRIKRVYIGGKTILATQLRSVLGLRSTRFTMSIQGNKVKFTTRGNGHGVGMCQYGANGLARRGHTYEEIIKYYYKGVEVEKYN